MHTAATLLTRLANFWYWKYQSGIKLLTLLLNVAFGWGAKWNGAVPFYFWGCLVGRLQERSGSVNRISFQDAERDGSKKSVERVGSRARTLSQTPHLTSPPHRSSSHLQISRWQTPQASSSSTSAGQNESPDAAAPSTPSRQPWFRVLPPRNATPPPARPLRRSRPRRHIELLHHYRTKLLRCHCRRLEGGGGEAPCLPESRLLAASPSATSRSGLTVVHQ